LKVALRADPMAVKMAEQMAEKRVEQRVAWKADQRVH
jgi:hypothetical protein